MKLAHALLFSISLGAIACGNDDGGDPLDAGTGDSGNNNGCQVEANFTSIQNNLLNTVTCNPDTICHGNPGEGGLNFKETQAAVHAALLGNTANAQGATTAPKRVTPNDINASFLYVKIANDNAPGGRMPLGGAKLNQCIIDNIAAWINAGAPNN